METQINLPKSTEPFMDEHGREYEIISGRRVLKTVVSGNFHTHETKGKQ